MILNEIAQKRRERIDALKAEKPLEPIRRLAEELASREAAAGLGFQPENFAFEQALKNPKTPGMAFICEVKKASPSKGVIAENFPFLEIAQEYESAAASGRFPETRGVSPFPEAHRSAGSPTRRAFSPRRSGTRRS